MRLVTRRAARLLALPAALTVLALGVSAPLAGPAAALTPITVTGSAPATAVGPGTITFSYTIATAAPLDSVSLHTSQDPNLAASTSAVTLDGAPVPPAQLSQAAGDLRIQAGPQPTDGLAAGSHTVTFTAAIAGTAPASTSSTATLDYSLTGTPGSVTSAPVLVALNQPDLAIGLTPDSGEDQLGLLGTGRVIDLLVDVSNLAAHPSAGILTIYLPAGLTLGSDGLSRDSNGAPVSCQVPAGHPQQRSCPLGAIQPAQAGDDPTLDIALTTTAGAPIGQAVPITVSVAPDAGQGSDTNPANDSVTVHLQYTGSARLSYQITPAHRTVALGAKTAVKLTIHNAGPQPAPSTIALTVLVGGNFSIASFTGRTDPPAGVAAGTVKTAQVNVQGAAELVWYVGDIPAGGSVSAVLTVQARTLGTGKLGIAAFSGASDPACPDFDCTPTLVALQVVPVPVPVVARPAGGGALAATGQNSTPALGWGAGLLLAGCLLAFAGRRPAPAYAGRRRAGG